MPALLLTILLGLSFFITGCPAMGYKKAAEAAMSPLSAPAQLRDQMLKIDLRKAILENQSFSGLTLTPAVFMEQGFVVGFVDTPEEAEQITTVAQQVPGLRSMQTYLPVRSPEGSQEADLATKGEIKAEIATNRSLVMTRYTIEVLDGVAVLLGVTMTEDEREEVEDAAREVTSVKDVKNWLLVVEESYSSLRPHLR